MARKSGILSSALTRRETLVGLSGAALSLSTGHVRAQGDWPAVEAGAKTEGKATLYHNLRPQGIEPLMTEFRKAYPGIQTQTVRLGSGPLIERYATEFAAGRNIADVMITFPDEALYKGIDEGGWALEWKPPELATFPASANHRNRMFAIQTGRNVIIWNKQRVKPGDAPKEWSDLADPKWKGRVGMDPPWRSVPVQALLAYWDQVGFADSAQKLKTNEVRFFEGSAGVMQACIRGDVYVATLVDLPLAPAIDDGAPIGFVYPASGTVTAAGLTFVNSKAPNPNAARVLVNWLLTARGQEVLQEQGGLAVTRPGTPPMKSVPATASLSKTIDQMEILTAGRQKAVIENWRTVFGIR